MADVHICGGTGKLSLAAKLELEEFSRYLREKQDGKTTARTFAEWREPVPPSTERTMTNEQIARVVHEANRAYCVTVGDLSQSAWDDAPEWQRASAVEGIQKAKDGATPEQLHDSWCAFKVADGWTFGAVKDAEAKTHPCLVTYDELPAEQRVKDHLFRAVVEACTAVV